MQYQGIDNLIYQRLPEGVSINLEPAGLAVRAYAYMWDFMFRAIILFVLGMIFAFLGDAGQGLLLIAFFVVSWGYYIYFEAKNGQTPGKKRYKLQVVQDNGLPPRIEQIILRNLLRPADAFPFAYALGMLVMVFGKEFKRIGDWASGTMVIFSEQNKLGLFSEKIEPLAPTKALSTEEQKLIISFAERCEDLSAARQQELANVLAPILGCSDQQAVDMLKGYAQYFMGQEA
ncbi:RDD family protein [Thalassotalea sp. PS06]|uniref:RDD family protein n=1 Tax=Thalassotalea sp. PS06 TaxID=2594005 RepID=UPI001163E80E|nr:RDD family protein [Thalassotalea sp. PS06]QDP02321.1 RDD family protein [Thalassotalea sp. PS06]